jgi:hypothetical protein
MTRAPLTSLSLSLCLLGLLASACAGDNDPAADPTPGAAQAGHHAGEDPTGGPAGAAGHGNAGQEGSGLSGYGQWNQAGAAQAGSAGGPADTDKGGSLRVVQLLAGAPSLDVMLGGDPLWVGLGWPAVTGPMSGATGLTLTASAGGKTFLSGTPALQGKGVTQVALVGLADGAHKLLSVPPSATGKPAIRFVHASALLHASTVRLGGDGVISNQATLSFGEVGEWQAGSTVGATYLYLDTDDRAAAFTLPAPVDQPTTVYLVGSKDNDLFAYAVGEDGLALRSDLQPTKTRLRFSHFGVDIGQVSFTVNNAPVEGVSPMTWGQATDYVDVDPQPITVRAIDQNGAVIASSSYDVKKFAEVSFSLVGGAAAPVLLSSFDGWSQLNQGSKSQAQLQLVDARPKGAAPMAVLASPGADAWSPLFPKWLHPASSTGWFNTEASISMLGLDMDLDGVPDYHFPSQYFSSYGYWNLTFTRDAGGRPWLWSQGNGGPAYPVLALEQTAVVQIWNLGASPLVLSSPDVAPIGGAWPDAVGPGMGSYPVSLVAGHATIAVSGPMVDKSLPLDLGLRSTTTLVAGKDGALIVVPTTLQMGENVPRVRLINRSAEPISASLGGHDLGAIAPGAIGPEVALAAPGASSLALVRADGSAISFSLASIYGGATNLLAYGGDPSWPRIDLLPALQTSPVVVHATELTTHVRVVAALGKWQDLDLSVDDSPTTLATIYDNGSPIPGTSFGVSDPTDIPIGSHTLHLGHGASQIDVPAVLEGGKETVLLVLPDLSVQILALDPASTDVTVVNTTLSQQPASVFSGTKNSATASLADHLAFGERTSAPYPGSSRFASVDWDMNGTPEWQSYLPVLPGSFILVVGSSAAGGVVCVKGGWAGLIGHAFGTP